MKHDDGMTLIELLISVLLVTIIIGALTTAMEASIRTVDAARERVSDTSGAQLLTSWLVSDAQSADHVNPASGCAGGSPLLELRWTAAADSTVVTDVVYSVEAQPGDAANSQLVRTAYSVSGGCTQTDREILVPAVSTVAGATNALCADALGTSVPCDGGAVRVGLHVTAFSTHTGSAGYTSYTFDVYGTRRIK